LKRLYFIPIVVALFLNAVSYASGSTSASAEVITPAGALKRLAEANKRFVEGKSGHPSSDAKRRLSLVENQHPFAVILGCSDSRVPPEVIFDQGLGDLFVIRVAGNIAGVDECGSIEYAVEHLETPLVVVLGHESCGAVTAAFGTSDEKSHEPVELQHILSHITPSLENVSAKVSKAEKVHGGVESNIRTEVGKLRKLPMLHEKESDGTLRVVGALYSLDKGTVTFLDSE